MFDDDMHPVVQLVGFLLMVAAFVWSTWCTVVAFTGGTLPLIGMHVDGGLGTGLAWIFVFDWIALTVAYWVALLILVPLSLVFRPKSASKR